MKRSEITQTENDRIRVTYRNKVGAINSVCGYLKSLSNSYLVWQPFGGMNQLSKRLEDVKSVIKINGEKEIV